MRALASTPSAAGDPLALRRVAAVAALVAAVVHLPLIPEHLAEAPYMGVLFVALTVTCVLLAGGLVLTEAALLYAVAALVCGAAIGGYALTRLVALPLLADDVGRWLEPLGVLAVTSEAVVVIACAALLRRERAER